MFLVRGKCLYLVWVSLPLETKQLSYVEHPPLKKACLCESGENVRHLRDALPERQSRTFSEKRKVQSTNHTKSVCVRAGTDSLQRCCRGAKARRPRECQEGSSDFLQSMHIHFCQNGICIVCGIIIYVYVYSINI